MKIIGLGFNLCPPISRGRIFLARLILAFAAVSLFIPKSLAAPPAGYNLIWSDEFNGTVGSAPNSSYWNYNLGENGWGNSELENYTNSTANSQIVSDPNATDDMALAIIALDPGGNNGAVGDYTSARINTYGKFSFQYGYIESRIQLPYGQGIWPTFWMMGNDFYSGTYDPTLYNGNWPTCGEVDIMENIGNTNLSPPSNVSGSTWQSTIDTALHMPGHYGAGGIIRYWALPSGQLYHNNYHLFAAQWAPGQMQIFMDGNFVENISANYVSAGQWVFDSGPFFIMLNIAVGGSFPGSPDGTTSFPQTMLVDYVRVYQMAPPTPTSTPAPTVMTTPTSTASITPPFSPILYPNPYKGVGQPYLNLSAGGLGMPVTIKFFTTGFRKVSQVLYSASDTESGTVPLFLTDWYGTALANGLYYVVVEAGSKQTTLKYLLTR